MTGVDPRIPIKPHESEYRGEARGRGRPLNSCKLITINQALFLEREREGWLNSTAANPSAFIPVSSAPHSSATLAALAFVS